MLLHSDYPYKSHPQKPERAEAIFKHLTKKGILEHCFLIESCEIENEDLELVHLKCHIEFIEKT